MTKCGEASMGMLGSTTSLQDSVSPSYQAKDDRVNIIKWLQIAEVLVVINVPLTNERRKISDGAYDERHNISLELYPLNSWIGKALNIRHWLSAGIIPSQQFPALSLSAAKRIITIPALLVVRVY